MEIKQIRNATIRVLYAGKTFLIDPWLAEKGQMGCFLISRAIRFMFRMQRKKEYRCRCARCLNRQGKY